MHVFFLQVICIFIFAETVKINIFAIHTFKDKILLQKKFSVKNKAFVTQKSTLNSLVPFLS